MVEGILAAAKEHGHDACGGYIRGMFGFFFNKGPVNTFADAAKSDGGMYDVYICKRADCVVCRMVSGKGRQVTSRYILTSTIFCLVVNCLHPDVVV